LTGRFSQFWIEGIEFVSRDRQNGVPEYRLSDKVRVGNRNLFDQVSEEFEAIFLDVKSIGSVGLSQQSKNPFEEMFLGKQRLKTLLRLPEILFHFRQNALSPFDEKRLSCRVNVVLKNYKTV
jgi:hypothetical protein